MLLLQICFTPCHFSGLLAESFTWLITMQSLGLDLPTLSLGSFTSAPFQVYLGNFYTPMTGLIFNLLHELFYPLFNAHIYTHTHIDSCPRIFIFAIFFKDISPSKITLRSTMDPETPEKSSAAWTDEAKVCGTLHLDIVVHWASMLAQLISTQLTKNGVFTGSIPFANCRAAQGRWSLHQMGEDKPPWKNSQVPEEHVDQNQQADCGFRGCRE